MQIYLPWFNINWITLIARHTPYRDRPIWKFICHCWQEFECRLHNVVTWHTKSCWCSTFIWRPRIPNQHSHYTVIYWQLKSRCKAKSIILNISIDDVIKLSQKNCMYCWCSPSNVCKPKQLWDIPPLFYNWIDRINSSIWYEKWNIVPCCKNCNYAKNTMSVYDFIKHIKKIYEHLEITKQLDEAVVDMEEAN